jgi:FemAB-related protein (PEP-CTERM system-associated)
LDKVSFVLELNEDPEVVWKAFGWEVRGRIRKSQKSKLTTEIGGLENLDDFYEVFSRNMRDLGTPVWGKDLFRNVLTEFPRDAEIILVRMGDEVIGGGLILSFKDTQYVPSASSCKWSLKYCPNNALYWSVIRRACENGCAYFDFGRSSRDSGTFRFKKKWGATVKQLVWQYHLNKEKEVPRISPDNPRYRAAIALWKRMPLRLANFLGPKLIRNFP